MADYKKMYLTALDAIERAMAFLVTFVATDKSNPPEAKKKRCSGRGRAPPLHTPTESPYAPFTEHPTTRRRQKGGPPPGGPPFSLSINPLYGIRGSFTQGELEGAKPASNWIKCRAKPCLARRAWSTPRVLASRREATIFAPQGGTKITTLFQAVERAKGFFDSLR